MKRLTVYEQRDLAAMNSLNRVTAALNHRNHVTGDKALYANVYGEFFEVLVEASMLYVWYGPVSILSKNIDGLEVDEILRIIEDRTREWSTGIVHCSDEKCDVPMRRFSDDIGGRYFAGAYCKACWSSKWSEEAAKETYD